MENVMELYYLLRDIESNFEDLYVQCKNRNILDDCHQLIAVKYKNILNLIMKIKRERKKYSLNLQDIYYIDKFLIKNFYNSSSILSDSSYYIYISYPLVGTEYSRNLISIHYNDNRSSGCLDNLISIYYNNTPKISTIYYFRNSWKGIPFSSNGIEILYRHCCKSNMLIIILSAQRKFSIKQRLPFEMYNFIYNEFLEYMMNF